METGNTNYIYRNNLVKACFQHDVANVKYRDLNKRTESDKVLWDNAFKIASNPKYGGYERGLALQWFTSFLIKNRKAVVLNLCQISNLQTNFINQLLENL